MNDVEFQCRHCGCDGFSHVMINGEPAILCYRCNTRATTWQEKRILAAHRPKFTPNTDELRALRLWHWRAGMSNRKSQQKYEHGTTGYAKRQAANCKRRANQHFKFVQALNDVVSGTAEQDDADK